MAIDSNSEDMTNVFETESSGRPWWLQAQTRASESSAPALSVCDEDPVVRSGDACAAAQQDFGALNSSDPDPEP
jgi:hypothetical protein